MAGKSGNGNDGLLHTLEYVEILKDGRNIRKEPLRAEEFYSGALFLFANEKKSFAKIVKKDFLSAKGYKKSSGIIESRRRNEPSVIFLFKGAECLMFLQRYISDTSPLVCTCFGVRRRAPTDRMVSDSIDSYSADEGRGSIQLFTPRDQPIPLGMASGAIPDARIIASDYLQGFPPAAARLDGPCAWMVEPSAIQPWIQVDLGGEKMIQKIGTQGRSGCGQWVSKFSIEYSLDGESWADLCDDIYSPGVAGLPKVFESNTNDYVEVANLLPRQIVARFIRIHVVAFNSCPALRLEFYGHSLTDDSQRRRIIRPRRRSSTESGPLTPQSPSMTPKGTRAGRTSSMARRDSEDSNGSGFHGGDTSYGGYGFNDSFDDAHWDEDGYYRGFLVHLTHTVKKKKRDRIDPPASTPPLIRGSSPAISESSSTGRRTPLASPYPTSSLRSPPFSELDSYENSPVAAAAAAAANHLRESVGSNGGPDSLPASPAAGHISSAPRPPLHPRTMRYGSGGLPLDSRNSFNRSRSWPNDPLFIQTRNDISQEVNSTLLQLPLNPSNADLQPMLRDAARCAVGLQQPAIPVWQTLSQLQSAQLAAEDEDLQTAKRQAVTPPQSPAATAMEMTALLNAQMSSSVLELQQTLHEQSATPHLLAQYAELLLLQNEMLQSANGESGRGDAHSTAIGSSLAATLDLLEHNPQLSQHDSQAVYQQLASIQTTLALSSQAVARRLADRQSSAQPNKPTRRSSISSTFSALAVSETSIDDVAAGAQQLPSPSSQQQQQSQQQSQQLLAPVSQLLNRRPVLAPLTLAGGDPSSPQGARPSPGSNSSPQSGSAPSPAHNMMCPPTASPRKGLPTKSSFYSSNPQMSQQSYGQNSPPMSLQQNQVASNRFEEERSAFMAKLLTHLQLQQRRLNGQPSAPLSAQEQQLLLQVLMQAQYYQQQQQHPSFHSSGAASGLALSSGSLTSSGSLSNITPAALLASGGLHGSDPAWSHMPSISSGSADQRTMSPMSPIPHLQTGRRQSLSTLSGSDENNTASPPSLNNFGPPVVVAGLHQLADNLASMYHTEVNGQVAARTFSQPHSIAAMDLSRHSSAASLKYMMDTENLPLLQTLSRDGSRVDFNNFMPRLIRDESMRDFRLQGADSCRSLLSHDEAEMLGTFGSDSPPPVRNTSFIPGMGPLYEEQDIPDEPLRPKEEWIEGTPDAGQTAAI